MSARVINVWVGGVAIALLCGCNMTQLAADSTVSVIAAGKPGIDRESDLRLARGAAENNLMMMEGLTQSTPENEELYQLMAEAYCGYAFGFVEDDLEASEEDSEEWEYHSNRAFEFYRRGRDAAHRKLQLQYEDDIPDLVSGGDLALEEALTSEMSEDDAPAMFWFANCWSSMINLRQDDPELIVSLGRVQRVMEQVAEWDGGYMDAGPHLFLGALKSSAPSALSDETEAAAAHFDKALEATGGDNLMIKVFRARYLHVARRDREAFIKSLEAVLEADPRKDPARTLVNTLAQRRAKRYLDQADDLFPPES